MQRRTFLEFIGKGTIASLFIPQLLQACTPDQLAALRQFVPKAMAPSDVDDLLFAEGFNYKKLISWNDPISPSDRFGFNNDYLCFLPDGQNPNKGLLWSNHEYVNAKFVSDYWDKSQNKTKEQVDEELYMVGGGFAEIEQQDGTWKVNTESERAYRVSGLTDIPFHWDEPIQGATSGMGTLANCSGGITPWGTVLTCEENYDYSWGERVEDDGDWILQAGRSGYEQYYDCPPEHYGWVVEVNPTTREARKLIALGRCAHECATMHQLVDGRLVVYTGDDRVDECFYKYVSAEPGDLKNGTLYVASLDRGKWISLNYDEQPVLQEHFENQTEVLCYVRKAARLVGGSLLDRPEDIEIDPITGDVLVTLTNNKPKGNYFGSILKITEQDGAYDSLSFSHDTYLAGGTETGFACPDNMAFDLAGNLWFTSDISGRSMNKAPYESFKNNGLFVVPRFGEQAGKVLQIASAPNDAEITGPYFSPDGRTLFLSVQHPGEMTKSKDKLTSNWPDGGNSIPKPSVVCVQGIGIEYFNHLDKLVGE